MASQVVVLRGGHRDGQQTRVDPSVNRLLTASEAPGLLDVYERSDEPAEVDGEDVAAVFTLTGQEPADGVAPELLHFPGSADVPFTS